MMKAKKSKKEHEFYEGDSNIYKDTIGNAALMLAMLMVLGSIVFLLVAFAHHEY